MTTFHPFPRLPLELREQIWKDTVEPRTVDVRRVRDKWSQPYLGRYGRLVSSTPIPATLHSCREARNLGLYERVIFEVDIVKKFENNHAPEVLIEKFFTPEEKQGEEEPEKAGCPKTEQRYVWLDLDIDRLDIGTSAFSDYSFIASAVKRLKFERDDPDGAEELMEFVNMEEIHIVCPTGFWVWAGVVYHYDWPCAEEKLLFIEAFSGRVARAMELEDVCRQDNENAGY